MIRKTKCSILAAAAGLALGAGILSAGAANPNLLQNGDFSSGIDHWELGDTTPWVGVDWWDGYAKVHNVAPWEYKTFALAGQCVPVSGGNEYTFSAQGTLPAGQKWEGGGQILLVFQSGDDCGGGQLTAHETGVGASGTTTFSLTRLAPPDAKSAWAYLSATKSAPLPGEAWDTTLTVHFDDVYFGLATAGDPVREEEERPGLPQFEEPQNPGGGPAEPQPDGRPQDRPADEPQRGPGDEPQREPGDEPQREPSDEPQGDPADEPQRDPADEPQREPQDDEPLTLGEPKGENEPLPPSTGTGIAADSPEVMLAAGVIAAAMAAALGGTLLMPAKRKR